jgi:hypothetical protein
MMKYPKILHINFIQKRLETTYRAADTIYIGLELKGKPAAPDPNQQTG